MILIENIESVSNQLMLIKNNIRTATQKGLMLGADFAVSILQNKFPDLNFKGQMFSESLEYWVTFESPTISKLIINMDEGTGDDTTGRRFNIKQEKQKGTTEPSYGTEFNMEEVEDIILREVNQSVSQSISEVLK